MKIYRQQRDVNPCSGSRIDHERIHVLREAEGADEDRVLPVGHGIDPESTEGVGAGAVIAWSEQDKGIPEGFGRVTIGDFAGNRCVLARLAGQAKGIASGRALWFEPVGLGVGTSSECEGGD